MAFSIDDPIGSLGLGNIKGGVYDIAIWVIYGLALLLITYIIWKKYTDKKIYIYPVRIHKQRNNGQVKEFNTFGGYIKKGQVTQFMIKMTKLKKKPADKLPLSEYMDEDNRVYYWQVSPEAPLIQVKRDFYVEQVLVPNEHFVNPTQEHKEAIIKKWILELGDNEEFKNKPDEEKRAKAIELFEQQVEVERNKLIDITKPTYTPVPTDLKQQALQDINIYKNTLGVDVNKQFAYFVIGVIALVIIGVIVFYIAVNKGDIPILTK